MQPLSPDPDESGADPAEKAAVVPVRVLSWRTIALVRGQVSRGMVATVGHANTPAQPSKSRRPEGFFAGLAQR
eukprot:1375229-Prymnesium_polylepis.1